MYIDPELKFCLHGGSATGDIYTNAHIMYYFINWNWSILVSYTDDFPSL